MNALWLGRTGSARGGPRRLDSGNAEWFAKGGCRPVEALGRGQEPAAEATAASPRSSISVRGSSGR
ncbi:MAG: hypothetical protein K0S86_507 [Geminicoccaceae bacterium]|jgi:hypothetical protein|nr:hypothetical protein [Geminicoccaceae bacterium]